MPVTEQDLVALFPEGFDNHGETNWTPQSGLCWWCAYREAEVLHEQNTLKDWAHHVLHGMYPTTMATVVDYVRCEIERLTDPEGDDCLTEEAAKQQIFDDISKFYELP